MFRNPTAPFFDKSVADQQKAVADIFDEMSKAGINPTPHTYSTLLHSLLSTATPNLPAARAVLTRMAAEKIKTSSHIYTILITHYFEASPPDLQAIDATWKRMQMEGTRPDHVFFDRMIEGYARCNEMEKMLHFLRMMPKAGTIPGWLALVEALRLLKHREEYELCAELVNDINNEKGLLRLGTRGWKGEEEFWALVSELRMAGLIPKAEID